MARGDRPDSSWANATWALLYYVVIPSVLLSVIMWRFPELSRERFAEMLRWVLILGTALVGINAMRAVYEVGSVRRLALDLSYVAVTIGWLLGILGGGTVLEQSWKGYEFLVDIKGLFAIIVALASLNMVYYGMRFAEVRGLLPGARPEAPGGHVTIEYVEDAPAL